MTVKSVGTYIIVFRLLLVLQLLIPHVSYGQKTSNTDSDASYADQRLRDQALRAFVIGCAADVLDDPVKALTAYRIALEHDDDPVIHVAAAESAKAAGNDHAAAFHFRAAASHTPENVSLHRSLASLYVTMEHTDSAITAYTRVLELQYDDAEALGALAQLLERIDPQRATTLYQRLLATAANKEEAAFRLAQHLMTHGSSDSAVVLLERMLSLGHDSDNLIQGLARLQVQSGNINRAITLLRELRNRHPSETMLGLQLAELLLSRSEWEEAAAILFIAVDDQGIGHEDRMQIGKMYFQYALSNPELSGDAITMFQRLEKHFPDDWRPLWFKGAVAFNSGDFESAAEDFQRVMNISPNNTDAGNILARSLLALRRFSEAKNCIEALVHRDIANAESYALLGHAAIALGDDEAAVTALESALKSNPTDIQLVAPLASAYERLNRFGEADELYEKTLRAFEGVAADNDAQYLLLCNNYAYSLAQRGIRLERALELSKHAVRHSPDNGAFLDTKAWILYRLERYEEALPFAQRAVILRENVAVLHEHLGLLYHALGRMDEAREAFELCLELNPDNDSIRKILEQLTQHDSH